MNDTVIGLLDAPKVKQHKDLNEVVVEQNGCTRLFDDDLNACLKHGNVIGSVALGYDKEGSDIDIVILIDNVPEAVLEDVAEDGVPVDYILEGNDVDPNSWFSVKMEDQAGITINLIVCYDTVAEFKWNFSAEVCKVADRMMKEYFGESPFNARGHRKAIYQQSCAVIKTHMEDV